jgi:hypothetical protein
MAKDRIQKAFANIATELHPNLEEEIRRARMRTMGNVAGKAAATWKTGSAPKRRSGGRM